ncbi:polymer-forming cytoskeletal protein [Halosegnis sp.]|uniref:bactofilin family protein n=1 Tax=Halosegnis sp. TaxID=2864959 RepID=UPI0035D4844A
MLHLPRPGAGGIALLLVAVVLLGTLPGIAAAEQRTGGSIVVEDGETVSEDLTAFGGTVVVRGTVDGDVTAFAGTVIIEPGGEVTGSVEATAGTVRIAGNVGGAATATGGNVFITETATIDDNLEVAAGTIVLAGAVAGTANLAGGSITLTSTASVDGNVEYATGEDGEFTNEGASVGGSVVQNENLSTGSGFDGPDIGAPLVGLYGFLVNVLVGGLLLLVVPDTSRRIANRVEDDPLMTGAAGLLALIGIPIGAALIAITIIGIPVTIAVLVAYALAVWIATVYGRYAVGATVLSYTDVENRWADLLVGLGIVAVLVRIPAIGGVFEFVVALLGLGAMAGLLSQFVRGQGGPEAPEQTEAAASA